jgi:hypothetical protein
MLSFHAAFCLLRLLDEFPAFLQEIVQLRVTGWIISGSL